MDFPLHCAARYDDVEELDTLLDNCDLNLLDNEGFTPLLIAVYYNSHVCLEKLLKADADVNFTCNIFVDDEYFTKMTPLILAVFYGSHDLVRIILEYDPDINHENGQGKSALSMAEENNNKEICDALEHEINRRLEQANSKKQQFINACRAGYIQAVHQLSDQIPNFKKFINEPLEGLETLLNYACEDNKFDIATFLVEKGANLKLCNETSGQYPIHVGCRYGDKKLVHVLLSKVPESIQYTDKYNYLPIHMAASNECSDVLNYLLKYPLELIDRDNWTYYTVNGCNFEFPFDINAEADITPKTALEIACSENLPKNVKILLDYRVQTVNDDGDNYSLLDESIQFIHSDGSTTTSTSIKSDTKVKESFKLDDIDDCNVIDASVANSFCPVEKSPKGRKPLFNAIKDQNYEVVEVLLTHGVNPNEMGSSSNESPLITAYKNGDLKMMNILLSFQTQDINHQVLEAAISKPYAKFITTILKYLVYKDETYQINKKALKCALLNVPCGEKNVERILSSEFKDDVYPRVPVAVNWRNDSTLYSKLKISENNFGLLMDCLIDAALHLNPALNRPASQIALFAITQIDISYNRVKELPESLFDLASLHVLDVSGNDLKQLPVLKSVYPTMLESLNVAYNHLTLLPIWLFDHQQSAIVKLDASNNELIQMPPEMWSSPKLEELDLSTNQLSSLPQSKIYRDSQTDGENPLDTEIKDEPLIESSVTGHTCKNSKNLLHISLSRLHSVDSRYSESSVSANYKQVRRHNVWEHSYPKVQIVEADQLSYGKKKLSYLKVLNLAVNQFTRVPRGLSCLAPALKELNLSFNQLTEVGHPSYYPSRLKKLNLSNNVITEMIDTCRHVKKECFEEKSLKRKDSRKTLTRRCLTCIHQSQVDFKKLTTLYLSNNRLTKLLLTCETNYDSGLEIHHKHLLFPNLSMIDLSYNYSLTEIGNDIGGLKSLQQIILCDTGLKILPLILGDLPDLWNIDVKNCHALTGYVKHLVIKNEEPSNIKAYLKSMLVQVTPSTRMTLIVVGAERVGKTLMLDKLRNFERSAQVSQKTRAERLGYKMRRRDLNGSYIATDGIDIHVLTMKQRGRNPEIILRTWDFGGQKNFHASHQYFMCQRAMYLVVWNTIDGEEGLDGVHQWLINIQAKAPGSPVIIVGTHIDKIKTILQVDETKHLQELGRIIRDRFMSLTEPHCYGLPNVINHIEISSKRWINKHISELASMIYTAAVEKTDGTGQPLIGQHIPTAYLDLEDIVVTMAYERQKIHQFPIIKASKYKAEVQDRRRQMKRAGFLVDELNQATKFLHSCGVLMHFDEPSFRDFYFIDPQWLYDMLATVVTVRSASLSRDGKMIVNDLMIQFKDSKYTERNIHEYIIQLLRKFELALIYDHKNLLITPLLPTEDEIYQRLRNANSIGLTDAMMTLRTVGKYSEHLNQVVTVCSKSPKQVKKEHVLQQSKFYIDLGKELEAPKNRGSYCETLMNDFVKVSLKSHNLNKSLTVDPYKSLLRLYTMTYFPSGFWPRLITRLLSDDVFINNVGRLYTVPENIPKYYHITKSIEKLEWLCYQTGMELVLMGSTSILQIRQIKKDPSSIYQQCNVMLQGENNFESLNMNRLSLLEIHLPYYHMTITSDKQEPVVIDRDHRTATKVLATIVSHIDSLLEEWFPDLGERFLQTLQGMYLVTRLVPCMKCWVEHHGKPYRTNNTMTRCGLVSLVNGDRAALLENVQAIDNDVQSIGEVTSDSDDEKLYCFTAEMCIDRILSCRSIVCNKHGALSNPDFMASRDTFHIAPDLSFLDFPDSQLINSKEIFLEKFLSCGGFGTVYKATLKRNEQSTDVAWKMFEPKKPLEFGSPMNKFHANVHRWNKNPLRNACESYMNARQESMIMSLLDHENIVRLIGLCSHPVSLVLELAPLGELSAILENYRRNGAYLSVNTIHQIILQISSALEYLHAKPIYHRDLKSSNIMVWTIPLPYQHPNQPTTVRVKLADYGISQYVMQEESKGYAGTTAFMAPEIIRRSGYESYNEKVDCFSFGMLLYELVTLHTPYENELSNDDQLKNTILNNTRPFLTNKCWEYPCHLLDIMVLCWCEDPGDRPSAAEINQIAKSPQFCSFMSAMSLPTNPDVNCVVPVAEEIKYFADIDFDDIDIDVSCKIWISCSSKNDITMTGEIAESIRVVNYKNEIPQDTSVVYEGESMIYTMCQVDKYMWCAAHRGSILIFSLENSQHVHTIQLSTDYSPITYATKMIFVKEREAVIFSMTNGKFIICKANFLNDDTIIGTFDGNLKPNHCMVLCSSDRLEVWCGQNKGTINIWDFDAMKKSPTIVNHFNPMNPSVKTHLLVSENQSVWSYTCPGNHVFRWDVKSRSRIGLLNCAKCIPSENQDIMKKHLNNGRLNGADCQVTAINVLYDELYIGTTWGCIIVADKTTLQQITTFRCHGRSENYVHAIIKIPHVSLRQPDDNDNSPVDHQAKEAIVSIGYGYRNLILSTKACPLELKSPFYKTEVFLLSFISENWMPS